MNQSEMARRQKQSWHSMGWTAIPNITFSRALPPNVRLTAAGVYGRAFGKRQGIVIKVETLAKDLGFSRQTIHKHLNILEAAGIIRRIRQGQRKANIIILNLKNRAAKLADSIALAIDDVKDVLFEEGKRTMIWWLDRWKIHKEAMVGRLLRAAVSR